MNTLSTKKRYQKLTIPNQRYRQLIEELDGLSGGPVHAHAKGGRVGGEENENKVLSEGDRTKKPHCYLGGARSTEGWAKRPVRATLLQKMQEKTRKIIREKKKTRLGQPLINKTREREKRKGSASAEGSTDIRKCLSP